MIGKKLNKVFSSKVFFIVFALILSVVLWMYVEINENQDMEKTIEFDSFVFLNEDIFNDRNFFITSMDPENVSLKIECPRLVAKSLDKNTVSLTVDLSKITSEGYTPLSYSVVYPNGVDTSQIRNQTKSVESIAFNVDIRKEREIRVEVPYNGGTASSELLAKAPEFEPQTITVSGPESVISRIRAAVVPIMRERLETTYVDDLPFILVDENDEELDETAVSTLKFSHDRIHVTIPVSTVKTVALTVNYIYGAGATANNIRDVIDPPFVTISGDPDAIADYNSI
ncbi:MAG: hypothetical protein LBH28_01945, partial [Oscillospiraceae bacterium]|nr:hypothetical protein [Oscillospiraceae bacterium]